MMINRHLLPLVVGITLYLLVFPATVQLGLGQTTVGFYRYSCPNAEAIVSDVVRFFYQNDRTIAPGLLRMHFHDCFVRGCDGSVLIDGSSSEKTAVPNLTLRGFEVIDDAKKELESICPGVVSCSDILALAARDSVYLTGGPRWNVPTGRRDGFVSSASDVNLPSFTDSVDEQKRKFADVGLNARDLVALLGGHTIGTAQCQTFSYRLYNFSPDGGPDPTINPDYLETLRNLCPLGGDGTKRVMLDDGSEFDFDRSYYYNLKKGKGLLESDQKLWTEDRTTSNRVSSYTGLLSDLLGVLLGGGFEDDFIDGMVKMGNIGVNTGDSGEIRRVCWQFNN